MRNAERDALGLNGSGMHARPWLTEPGNGRPPALSEQHAAARYWAAQGFPVCRLIERDKRPTDRAPRTIGSGPEHRLASTELEMIDAWWREVHPYWGPRAGCNPGLPTGRWPGYLALDVDQPRAFHEWVAGRAMPDTLRWSSCRPDRRERYTLLFRYPEGLRVRSVADGQRGCVPGVDLRAEREHVVLPGAIHPSGSRYLVQRSTRPGALPAWLVAELVDRSRTDVLASARPTKDCGPGALAGDVWARAYHNATRLFERAAAGACVTAGQRHRTLVGLAWEGLARGLRAEDVRRIVLGYVRRACPDDHERREASRQLAEALARPRPRSGASNQARFSVAGQAEWLRAREAESVRTER